MAVWTAAWLQGNAAPDDVLDALHPWAEAHDVRAADEDLARRLDLPDPSATPAGMALLLPALRRAGAAGAELVLPVAGDVRGLGAASEFARTALARGQAAVLPQAQLGLVPQGPHEGLLRWTVFETGALPPSEHMPIGEAEHGMSSAMREAASTLTDLDVAKHRPGVRAEIAEKVAARPEPSWPAEVPQRPLRVLQRAAEVEAILLVATEDSPGAAVSASETRARTDTLRPLFDAVRAARCASVAEMVRVLADRANQT